MKYTGSKNRIAKYILPIILEGRKKRQWYVEPFAGGMNLIDKVEGFNRLANDSNKYIIACFRALQKGWLPPNYICEDLYKDIRINKDNYPDYLVGFVGVCCSFSGKWFGGYARGKNNSGIDRNYTLEQRNSLLKQIENLKGVTFTDYNYNELYIPEDSIIYCDPPYKNSIGYLDKKFNHVDFWQWVRDKTIEGFTIYVSEYSAPKDFIELWSKPIHSNLHTAGSLKMTEKLFFYFPYK